MLAQPFSIRFILATIISTISFNAFAEFKTQLNPKDYFKTIKNPIHGTVQPLWGKYKFPYPTSIWFQNLTLKNTNEAAGIKPIFPYPYSMASTSNGMNIALSKMALAKTENGKVFAQLYPYAPQFLIAAAETGDYQREIIDGNEAFVKLKYQHHQHKSITASVFRGSPYFTMFYNELTPLLHPTAGIHSVNHQPPGAAIAANRRFIVTLDLGTTRNEQQVWVVYTETPIQLSWQHTDTGWQLVATEPYQGWLRAALLKDTSIDVSNDIDLIDQNAEHIPMHASIQYQFNSTQAKTILKWQTLDQQAPLLMAQPHQQASLKNQLLPEELISMRNAKGNMRGIIANEWHLTNKYPIVDFLEKIDTHKLTAKQRKTLIASIQNESIAIEATLNPQHFGVYTSGKRFARAARMALLAHKFDLYTEQNRIVAAIEENLKSWIQGSNKWSLHYDETWGGIIPIIDDFGSQGYNDHHFHYGYFVYTFAALNQLDPEWMQTAIQVNLNTITPKQWVQFLIRDYANPSEQDEFFPYSRHSDAVSGHSWASGIGQAWADGRNQESVSEAANAYYAIALLGKSFKEVELENWGKLLLARELNGATHYWFLDENREDISPEYYKSYHIVTNMWEAKLDAHSWFGANIEYSYGIEMLPFNGITSMLLSKRWLQQNQQLLNEIYNKLPIDNVGWKGLILKPAALAGQIASFDYWWQQAQHYNQYDEGDSKANTLYILLTNSTD